jgi:hypothetical protein
MVLNVKLKKIDQNDSYLEILDEIIDNETNLASNSIFKQNSINHQLISFDIKNLRIKGKLIQTNILELVDNKNTLIYNPMILGKIIDCFGNTLDNSNLYSLKKPKPNHTPISNTFFLNEIDTYNFDSSGLSGLITLDNPTNSPKSLINLQSNNGKNWIFVNIYKNNLQNNNLRQIQEIYKKYNLEYKTLFVVLENLHELDYVIDYQNFFKDILLQNTAFVINTEDWEIDELLEFSWFYNNKMLILNHNSTKENKHQAVSMLSNNRLL